MPVALQSRQSRVRVSLPRLRAVARVALGAVGRARAEVHVTVVDDRTIRRLNARYQGSRKRTDVLAFDLGGPGPAPFLGEVIVSADTAARQAAAVGVSVALELDLLVIHGILHLAGWDDARPAQARPGFVGPVELDVVAGDHVLQALAVAVAQVAHLVHVEGPGAG